ncbi:MAG: BolA/IbaG family iron-sulfur metabolism protein [Candidatus Dadabacteria bacterium]|nr:BolA/IbaG family iron-sulfur metabolism protein [Candidatus Dadabacteria bacterium]
MDSKEIKTMIQNGMSNLVVNVDGDGTHFEALIVSTEFEGKSLIERHKVVYGVLGDAMKERIHALSLKTFTPEQWESQK